MRRATVLLVLTLVVLWSTTVFGQIVGSAHDMDGYNPSGTAMVVPEQRICLPCHVPHNAYPYDTAPYDPGGVLWNHQETAQSFTPYVTQSGVTGAVTGTSKKCLSCHDGVTAVDNYGGTTDATTLIVGDALIGTDLSNDHPIGVAYPPVDPTGYNDPPTADTVKIINNQVECASCHDPHGAGYPMFLRDTIVASALCLDCHNK